MGILLIRHAEAVKEHGGIDDAARWLSPAGRAQARATGALIKQKGLALSILYTSPRVRAVQTGELVAEALGFPGPVEVVPSLSYTVPAHQAAQVLEKLGATEHVGAVGHMPTIAGIAARLTGGAYHGLELAEAVFIDDGRVVWSVAPR